MRIRPSKYGNLAPDARLTFGKPGSPWKAAHASRGCSQEDMVATGGAELVYCFAEK
jgi:hypothetical protein